MAELRRFIVSPFLTNCYALISGGQCMVIDPGDRGKDIADQLLNTNVTLIAATHGHNDHVSGVAALKAATGAQFVMSKADYPWAKEHTGKADSSGQAYGDPIPEPDRLVEDGDTVQFDGIAFKVIATPGHTPGGVVYVGPGFAFVGDTLFKGSCGRTDLPNGNAQDLAKSLRKLKQVVPPDTTIFCGHGPETTMEYELQHNPYLKDQPTD